MFILFDFSFSGYNIFSLDLLYIIAVLLGVFVVIVKNPIMSVLMLIGLFLCMSVYLILTGLTFIGLSYLLVYIGAVSILFLFTLMLINVRVSELLMDSLNSVALTLLIGGLFTIFVYQVLPFMVMNGDFLSLFSRGTKVDFVTSSTWDGNIAESSHITSIGNILYGSYSIWLIITSIILLLAMVGCIVITLKDKSINNEPKYNPFNSLQSSIGYFKGLKSYWYSIL